MGIGQEPLSSTADKDKATLAEVGALCNAAKYVAAEAAFEACERAGKFFPLQNPYVKLERTPDFT